MRCFTDSELAAFVAKQRIHPVPMILYCPNCGVQHIDAEQDEEEHKIKAAELGLEAGTRDWETFMERRWLNDPHASHECQKCHHVWRPADCATTGVATLQTVGTKDKPLKETPESVYDKAMSFDQRFG